MTAIASLSGCEPLPSYYRDLLVSRAADGTRFGFLPTLCRVYDLPAPHHELESEDYSIHDVAEYPTIEAELLSEIQTRGLKNILRKHGPGLAIILSQNCNLGCSYCLAKRGTFGLPVAQMRLAEVKESLRALFERRPDIQFIKFFGGEPTLRFDLIEAICSFVRDDLGKNVGFALTTNGTRNARRHIDVWREFRVSVSVSIDGPREIHDQIRTRLDGRGSYDEAREYCEILDANKVGFSVVGVFDERHIRSGLGFLETIRFLNGITDLCKVQFVEALGDAEGADAAVSISDEDIRAEIHTAVDGIIDNCCAQPMPLGSSRWLYDNNIFRFISGLVGSTARPYEHACTASNLTTLFPSGLAMPCYTFSERPELNLGVLGSTSIEAIEEKRHEFRANHAWSALQSRGTTVPWYRGIVGDICVADMMNAGGDHLESSRFYRLFQETSVLRILQRIVEIQSDALRLANLLYAVQAHKQLTGAF